MILSKLNKIHRYAWLLLMITGQSHAALETIALDPGWNLISSSLQNRSLQTDSASTKETVELLEFNPTTQTWSNSTEIASPSPHQGFWYKAQQADTLQITGSETDTKLEKLSPPWLLTGPLSTTDGPSLIEALEQQFAQQARNLEVTSLYRYKAGQWQHYNPLNATGRISGLQAGDAIWAQIRGKITTTEDQPVQTTISSITGKETDKETQEQTEYKITQQASKGAVEINTAGVLTYTPYINVSGVDQFVCEITDPEGIKQLYTIIVETSAENDLPLVANEEYPNVLQAERTPLGKLLENDTDADGDQLQIISNTAPENGTVTIEDGVYYYTSNQDYAGSDHFTYQVSDGIGDPVEGSVTLTVIKAGQSYTISGTISAGPGMIYDSDVNHPNAPCAYNGSMSIEITQQLLNPATVGGYVRTPGQQSGTQGRARGGNADGCLGTDEYEPVLDDQFDFYKVPLLKGQEVGLYLGDDPKINDIDLLIYNDKNIDSSLGTGDKESITVSESGDYYILVFAVSGASNYVLTIGQSTSDSLAPSYTTKLNSPFIPGELIVRQKNHSGMGRVLAQQADTLGIEPVSGDASKRSALYRKAADTSTANRLFRPHQTLSKQIAEYTGMSEMHRAKLETIYLMKELQQNPSIENVELNYRMQPQAATETPNDQLYGKQWHYPMINLPQAWSITKEFTPVNAPIVAVIDTGVLLQHPDLQGQIVSGYDFISDPTNAGDGDGIDNNPNDNGDGDINDGGIRSSSFHGTHVAGTVAAASDNDIGGAGVAWGAKIMPLRALGKTGGSYYDMLQAMRYAGGLSNDSESTPQQAADIINMSLGGVAYSSAVQDLVTELRQQGVVIVAAAGNDNSAVPFYPASYDGVISVSAVGFDPASLAPYSNHGAYIDLAAPGGDMENNKDLNGDGTPDGIVSTGGTDTGEYVINLMQGTSMASPHVAGVVALMRTINPELTPQQLDLLISNTSISNDLGDQGRDDRYGYGLIDAYKAVTAASQWSNQDDKTTTIDPVLTIHPATANFGMTANTLTIDLSNSTEGELTVTSIDPETATGWLQITPQQEVGSDGLGGYALTIDRDQLQAGPHTTSLLIQSTAGDLTLPVIVYKADENIPGDAGYQTVLLIETTDNQVIERQEVKVDQGEYHYSFQSVPAGSYYIIAGTDSDYDQFICDPGEACGAYPFYEPGNLKPIIINQHTTLNFSTGFDLRMHTTASAQKQSEDNPVVDTVTGYALPVSKQ